MSSTGSSRLGLDGLRAEAGGEAARRSAGIGTGGGRGEAAQGPGASAGAKLGAGNLTARSGGGGSEAPQEAP
jgi:hypothetical protein